MLVNELCVPISGEHHAELVEMGDVALKLDTIHQEHRHRNALVLNVAQEHLLEALRTIWGHVVSLPFALDMNWSMIEGRGIITITDRAGLEEVACECFGTIRRSFERLLPQTYSTG